MIASVTSVILGIGLKKEQIKQMGQKQGKSTYKFSYEEGVRCKCMA